MEPSGLIWTLVGLVAVLMVALLVAVAKLWSVTKEIRKLNGSLEKLDARLQEQERQLQAVRSALDDRGSDLFGPFVEAFERFKSKGWVAAATMLGSHVFRSYLKGKRRPALPKKDASE